MTDRAKRGSNICGIATRNCPARDLKAPSAATGRPSPPLGGLDPYPSIHGFRCALAQKRHPGRASVEFAKQRVGVLSLRRPRLAYRELKPCGGAFDPHITGGMTMTIKVGDKLPSVTLRQVTPEGPKEVTTDEFFRGKKVALFAVPGAFTPACSQRHLPGYVEKAVDIKSKGVDEVACVAVNDAAVMTAWGKDQRCEGKVSMLADGSGDLARALGLELDLTKMGLGV